MGFKLSLLAVALLVIFSGCLVSERTDLTDGDTGQVFDPLDTLPDGATLPPQLPEIISPKEITDSCAWTLDVKNFLHERNPAAMQAREYNSCYTNNYLLKINAQTSLSFCNGIVDESYLVDCYRDVAKKSGNFQNCELAPQQLVNVLGYSKKVPVGDACYFRVVTSYFLVIEPNQRVELCSRISDTDFGKYCLFKINSSPNQS